MCLQVCHNGSAALSKNVTEGPYYVAEPPFRKNITEGQLGVPLELRVTVVDQRCTPVGAFFDVWHNNATGVYSAFEGQCLRTLQTLELYLDVWHCNGTGVYSAFEGQCLAVLRPIRVFLDVWHNNATGVYSAFEGQPSQPTAVGQLTAVVYDSC